MSSLGVYALGFVAISCILLPLCPGGIRGASQDSLVLFPEVSLGFIVSLWESCHFSKISPYISILPDPGQRGRQVRGPQEAAAPSVCRAGS